MTARYAVVVAIEVCCERRRRRRAAQASGAGGRRRRRRRVDRAHCASSLRCPPLPSSHTPFSHDAAPLGGHRARHASSMVPLHSVVPSSDPADTALCLTPWRSLWRCPLPSAPFLRPWAGGASAQGSLWCHGRQSRKWLRPVRTDARVGEHTVPPECMSIRRMLPGAAAHLSMCGVLAMPPL